MSLWAQSDKMGPEVKAASYRISRNLICAIEFAYRL